MNHLKRSEFVCKCGCGLNNLQEGFFRKLVIARNFSNTPFVINSGCRCQAHNENEGGSDTSSHLMGWAADIETKNSRARGRIVRALYAAGITRVGIAGKFIHADDDPNKAPDVMWLYE